jgi:hypothetical protein
MIGISSGFFVAHVAYCASLSTNFSHYAEQVGFENLRFGSGFSVKENDFSALRQPWGRCG